MLKEQPDLVKFTMLDTTLEKLGAYGSERVKAIKNSFNFIIENILPLELRGLYGYFNNVSIDDWTKVGIVITNYYFKLYL